MSDKEKEKLAAIHADMMADAPPPLPETNPEELLTPKGVELLTKYPKVREFYRLEAARMKRDPLYIMGNFLTRMQTGEIMGKSVGARITLKAIAEWFERYIAAHGEQSMNGIMGLTGRNPFEGAEINARDGVLFGEMIMLRALGKSVDEAAQMACRFLENADPALWGDRPVIPEYIADKFSHSALGNREFLDLTRETLAMTPDDRAAYLEQFE